MSKALWRGQCPNCSSSDAYTFYDDGHGYCYSCEKPNFEKDKNNLENEWKKTPAEKILEVPKTFGPLRSRGISEATARKYGVWCPGGSVELVYPHYEGSTHVSNKLRLPDKQFRWEGDIKRSQLFGQNLFPPGSAKAITVTEGNDDAMAAFEMQGSRYPCVSVHSAGSAHKNVADNFEYLNSFPKIVICFDKDERKEDGRYPGQEAAQKVAAMFPIGKVHVLTLEKAKDANDYHLKGLSEDFRREWWAAPVFTPMGIRYGRDMWDEVATPKDFETVLYPWAVANDLTYGIRLSELVVVTAPSGVGKTSFLKEIEHRILTDDEVQKKGYGLGLLHLEETNRDTAIGLMSITAEKPLHLPDVRKDVNVDELRGYYDKTVNTDRLIVWDHFGSNSIEEVLSKIRHMHNLGCKYIFLDHLSIVVSDQSGDERKQLDEITTKLKTLCMELNIAVVAVIHQNRAGQIRGTAGVEQLANIVFKLERNKIDVDEWRRNILKVVIDKNRFCGRTGPGLYLRYDDGTGRLVQLTDEEIRRYESGEGGTSIDPPW